MSEIIELTVQTYGVEIDLVVEVEVEPEEPQTYDSPGCPGGIEITGVWRNSWLRRDYRMLQKRDHAIRSGQMAHLDLLANMTDEEVEHLATLAGNELDSQAEDAEVDHLQGLAEDRADARRDDEMARWP